VRVWKIDLRVKSPDRQLLRCLEEHTRGAHVDAILVTIEAERATFFPHFAVSARTFHSVGFKSL